MNRRNNNNGCACKARLTNQPANQSTCSNSRQMLDQNAKYPNTNDLPASRLVRSSTRPLDSAPFGTFSYVSLRLRTLSHAAGRFGTRRVSCGRTAWLSSGVDVLLYRMALPRMPVLCGGESSAPHGMRLTFFLLNRGVKYVHEAIRRCDAAGGIRQVPIFPELLLTCETASSRPSREASM